MKTREKNIEPRLRDWVKKMGGLCLKLPAIYFTGLPDRLVLLPQGRICFVETKSQGGRCSPRQCTVHATLRNLGFEVWVMGSEETFKEFKKKYEVSAA